MCRRGSDERINAQWVALVDLVAERDSLTNGLRECEAVRRADAATLLAVVAERDTLRADRDGLITQVSSAWKEFEMAVAERDLLRADLEAACDATGIAGVDAPMSLVEQIHALRRRIGELEVDGGMKLAAVIADFALVKRELEKDRERLDWLCSPLVCLHFNNSYRRWDGESDFRAAIDAARANEEKS